MSVSSRSGAGIHGRTLPWLTLALSGSMALLYLVLGPAPPAWVYDRDAIVAGEWWRLVSGHWVHSDLPHLGWNLGATLLLGGLLELRDRRAWLIALAAGTGAVDAALWFGLPGLTRYCGLSGVLNAVLLPLLFALGRTVPARLLALSGALSLGKILTELAAGQALFTQAAWPSLPEAHLAGWLAGLLPVVPMYWRCGCRIGYRSGRRVRLFRFRCRQECRLPRLQP